MKRANTRARAAQRRDAGFRYISCVDRIPLREPETDAERATLLRLALRFRSAPEIAADFRWWSPDYCRWKAADVRRYAKSGGYYDWRVPHLMRIVEWGLNHGGQAR